MRSSLEEERGRVLVAFDGSWEDAGMYRWCRSEQARLILDAWHRDEVRCRLAKRVAMVGKRQVMARARLLCVWVWRGEGGGGESSQ